VEVRSKDLKNYRSRCFTLALILDYFCRQGVNCSTLLHGTGVTEELIDNPHNWIPVTKLQRIMQNCYCVIPNFTLYDWQKVSLQIKYSIIGSFLRGISSIGGAQTMYMLAPRYLQRNCNYQHLELILFGDGIADFITYLLPDVVSITSGCMFQLTAGMLAAVPVSHSTLSTKVAVLFDQSPLKNIIKKMYRHHGLSYRQKGDRIHIENRTIGRKVRLEEELIKGKYVYKDNYIYKPPYNAILITKDLKYKDIVLLRRGDIFDAPYTRIRIYWDTNYENKKQPVELKQDTKLARQTFLFLEKQIKLVEDHFFESEILHEKERKVSEKLKLTNRILKKEIKERRKAELLLKSCEKEMDIQTANMQEADTALRVLLKKREEDKKKFSEKVLFNIKELIIPYLEKLKKTDLNENQKAYVEVLESNFEELSNPLALKLSFKYFDLTRAEIRVAILIKQGRTTQQIADLLSLSPRTIDAYRANIRRKLKIKRKKINLCTYLNSI
jgi:DNA-binding CsgD family transcriptional regulator